MTVSVYVARMGDFVKVGVSENPKHRIAVLRTGLWKQCLPKAQRLMSFEVTQRQEGHANVTVWGTCPADATVAEVEERFYHWYFGGRGAWVKDGQFGCTIHTD